MLPGGNVDKKWSDKIMEGDDGLRTVECLRGRLLAERVASRVAKEDAEFMGNQLIELERQIEVEIKSRNKAEKKLKFLTKKLESLKISPILDQSSSSENSKDSSRSSTTDYRPANSVRCNIEEVMGKTADPITIQDLRHHNSETSMLNQGHKMPLIEGNSSCDGTAHSRNNSEGTSPEEPDELKEKLSTEEFMTNDPSRQSTMEEKEFNGENNPEELVDNSLALVPTSTLPASQICEPQIDHASVRDVLAALRHAREKLQSSMGRRDVYSHSVELCGGA